jgi:hypothetical protein
LQEALIIVDPQQLPWGCTQFMLQRSTDRKEFQTVTSFQKIPSQVIVLADPVGDLDIYYYRVIAFDQNGCWKLAAEQVYNNCLSDLTPLKVMNTTTPDVPWDPHGPVEEGVFIR